MSMFRKNSGKTVSVLLAAILTGGVLAGCGDTKIQDAVNIVTSTSDVAANSNNNKADNVIADSNNQKWTVLLYLCGTDLESVDGSASANLEEIFEASLSENVNFIIQTGGTSKWHTDGIDSDKIQRFKVENGALSLIDEQATASMGDSDTLGSFLKWSVEKYPADKYMLTFWNHGGGSVSGVAFDELYNDDSLTLTELSEGLSQAGVNFEVIGFDTCLMATIENAIAIAPYGKYLVASEEYEPGGGWDYTEWVSYLSSNTNCNGEELGKKICDSYFAKCAEYDNEDMATLSVTNLSKVDALKASFEKMSSEMTGVTEDISSFKQLARSAVRAENYGGNTDEEGYTNMVDLGDLVYKTKDVLPETSADVIKALSEAVVYQVKGTNRTNANGLSVFYPLSMNPYDCEEYASQTDNTSYLMFIDTLCEDWEAPDWVYGADGKNDNTVNSKDYTIKISQGLDENNCFAISIDSGFEIVESVKFSLYYMDIESNEFLRLGLDNDIISDWENGIFTDNFEGFWTTIGDCYVAPELIYEEENYDLYSIPVMLNGEQTNLRAVYDYTTYEFEILGAYDGIDSETGMSSRNIRKLKNGDELEFLFYAVDADTGETSLYSMGSVTYNTDMKMEYSELFDGNYLYQYEITDIFGNVTYSDTAVMECDDGDIYIYEIEE